MQRQVGKVATRARVATPPLNNQTRTQVSTSKGGAEPPKDGKSYSTAAATEAESTDHFKYNYDIMAGAFKHPGTPQPYVREVKPCAEQPEIPMDGNQAASYVAYALSETSFIYPISPATSMGEHMDAWSGLGRKNCFGQPVAVRTMQSEGGAVASCHGAISAGVLTSTFTASQGLLLMIPNLYLMAGELMPAVLHVSARTISKHALSIFNDHSDVMACRQTGFAFLCSNNVQEVMDFGLVAHIASMRSRVPFLHFFDGFRTSHEIAKIKTIPYGDIEQLIPHEELKNFRGLGLNPQHPIIRGTGQRPDIFFQATVAAGRFYDACPDVVQAVLDEVAQLTGRQYKLFEYHGSPTAERVMVMMGSAAETSEDVVDRLNEMGENVGVLKVRLYRPWSAKHFLATLPKTVKSIAVMDRTREDGAQGNPLYLDICSCIMDTGDAKLITGGVYGLASKEFTPGQVKAIFDNLSLGDKAMKRFVVGIDDDVTHSSLQVDESFDTVPAGTTQCMFWGLGGDGTIGANKAAIKNLALDGGLNAQGYFSYDSHKEMGATISHLRFGTAKIKAHYLINSGCHYIACHHPSYARKYDLCNAIKEGGIFVLNCPWTDMADFEKNMSPKLKKDIATNNVKFFVVNATGMALELGLGKRINTIMQSCFYRLSGVLPVDKALGLLKISINELYSKKGPEVVKANEAAVDAAEHGLRQIEVPAHWGDITDTTEAARDLFHHPNVPKAVNDVVDSFVHDIMDPVLALEGDKLPVSTFVPGGPMPTATCMHEKRGLAPEVPVWEPDKCTQCNYCAIVCPHAVIRPFLLDRNEVKAAPEGFEARKATGGAEYAGLNFSIQISTNDCTGCAICVASCPDDALHMEPYEAVKARFLDHFPYAITLPNRNPGDRQTVKGSQFSQPLLEFSGACPGCGETPYVKLLTQLYGERMVIANASGCSSVWGGTATTNPYTVDERGRGPAWGRSLFEDNAEYGYGMVIGTKTRRAQLKAAMEDAILTVEMPQALKSSFQGLVANYENYDKADKFVTWIEQLLPAQTANSTALARICDQMDIMRPQSHWIIGGDGWAYDIGYGGLDHVLSRSENVNVMVLDTEMYSNTGGQMSKSTQMSTVLKFASSGKPDMKKDMGMMAMSYGHVYVASIALGANYNQSVQAIREAESYDGPSLILCYSPCIDWGIDMQYQMESQKIAVDAGYWKLYRFDPRLADQGKSPMQLDSAKIKTDVKKFLETQNRFKQLIRKDKKKADAYFTSLAGKLISGHEAYRRQSMDNYELLDHLKGLLGESVTGEKALVLFASETGTAAEVAKAFSDELKRRGIRGRAVPMDDYDFDNLCNETKVVMIAATCGQGEFPDNSKAFWKAISNPSLPSDWLANTKFATFALGDTAYVYYNKVGKDFDSRFLELGATRMVNIGLANEKDDEKWETAWTEWIPEVYDELGADPPPAELPAPVMSVEIKESGSADTDIMVPPGAKLVPLKVAQLLTPPGYDRDVRHFDIDISQTSMVYNLGDSLGIYAWNPLDRVHEFLSWYGLNPAAIMTVNDPTESGKFAGNMTVEQVFCQVLDIFGRPTRRFYELLSKLATDPKEAEEINFLMSKEGKEAFKEFLKETPDYSEVMKKFSSAKVPLDYLLDYVPRVKPRLYSIASCPDADGDNLQLCIIADEWTTPAGKDKIGTTTNYLKCLAPTADQPVPVAARVNTASFALPANPMQPIIMVALGTGIAPCRALIRNRMHAKANGEEIGKMGLFFGVRNRHAEYSYGEEEWEPLHDGGKGPLTVLANAFSRDQEKKVYVQHRLQEHKEMIYQWIVKENGYYLLCGPGGPPAVQSKQAVIDAIAECGAADGFTPEKAVQYVTDMQISGRFNEEVW